MSKRRLILSAIFLPVGAVALVVEGLQELQQAHTWHVIGYAALAGYLLQQCARAIFLLKAHLKHSGVKR